MLILTAWQTCLMAESALDVSPHIFEMPFPDCHGKQCTAMATMTMPCPSWSWPASFSGECNCYPTSTSVKTCVEGIHPEQRLSSACLESWYQSRIPGVSSETPIRLFSDCRQVPKDDREMPPLAYPQSPCRTRCNNCPCS